MEKVEVIYKQDALEALRMCYETERIDYTNGNEYINYEQAVHEIEYLSTAMPERKKGNWLKTLNNRLRLECSECGTMYGVSWNFCPNCGAKMEGEQE